MAIYTDSFTGVNGTDLPDHDANWVDVGDGNVMEIQSNQVTSTVSSGFHGYYYNQTFNSKHYCKLTINSSSLIGPGIRMASGSNYYYCFAGADNITYNGEVVAGAATDWDSGLPEVGAGAVVKLAVDATTEGTIHYKVDDVTVETYTSKTSLSGGRAGVVSYRVVGTVLGDNWEGGDVSAGGLQIGAAMRYYRNRRV